MIFLLHNTRVGSIILVQVFNDGVRVRLKRLDSDTVMIDCSLKFFDRELLTGRISEASMQDLVSMV